MKPIFSKIRVWGTAALALFLDSICSDILDSDYDLLSLRQKEGWKRCDLHVCTLALYLRTSLLL